MIAPALSARPWTAAVAGRGFLADHLARHLPRWRREANAIHDTDDVDGAGGGGAHGGPVLLVAELDGLAEYDDVLVDCVAGGRPLLFVGTWRALVFVGPRFTPGRPGCPHCLVSRTANSAFGPDLDGDALAESSRRDVTACSIEPAALGAVTRYVAASLTARPAPAPDRVIVVDGATGTVEPQTLLPDSTCPTCGATSGSTGGSTVPAFTDPGVPLTKLAAGTLRTAELDAAVVERDYLFAGLGLFKELRQDLQSPFGACSVELPARWGRREPAIGRAPSYRTSRTVAVLEGLERYAGLRRGGRTAPVRAAYAEVAGRALYPPLLGTHPERSYRTAGFRYRPFDPNVTVDWVWAWSFRSREPVLVPERAAFWGPRHDGEVSFAFDTSNGCALGNSVEEAILHGLRELAERDSFLLAWYRRLALPEVVLDGADERIDELLGKARLYTGFEFRCFASTMEHRMPSFWLVAENRGREGPAVLAGSGAHPDPVQAIVGGLYELVGIVLATAHDFAGRRELALPMLDDPDLVRRMPDHSLLGAMPQARERYSFLLDSPPQRIALADVAGTIRTGEPDLRADLDTAVDGFLAAGLDVLVVDQTMPELARNGLHCVRVLAPGLVPMTFGHANRRTCGLPRLSDGTGIPYRSQLPDGEEPGCIPHPFP